MALAVLSACQVEPDQVARDLVTSDSARRELRRGLDLDALESKAADTGEKLKQLEGEAATKSQTDALTRQLESRPTQESVNVTARNVAQDEVGRFDANVRAHAVEVFRDQYQGLLKRIADAESGLADMQSSYTKEIVNRGQLLDGMARHLWTQAAAAVETGQRLGRQLREFEQLMDGLSLAYEGLGLKFEQKAEISSMILALESCLVDAAAEEMTTRVGAVDASFKGVPIGEEDQDRRRRLDGVEQYLLRNLDRSLAMAKVASPQLQKIEAAYASLKAAHEAAGTDLSADTKRQFDGKLAELRQAFGGAPSKQD
jgi:hypothetical protein